MLKGTVALVTGGGSGLGLATVERFVKQGAKVVIADLSTSKSQEIAEQFGKSAIFSPTDVISEKDVQTTVNLTKEKFGKLNFVVNCAGIGMPHTTYDFKKKVPHGLADFSNILMVNTVGTFNVIRLAVGLMGENEPNEDGQRGVIVNASSIAAYDGPMGLVAYAASKGALNSMTLPIARDLSSQGIRVVTIAAGFFDTPMLPNRPEEVKTSSSANVSFPQRNGKPSEYAQLVQSVIENPLLNGEVIRLDNAVRL